MKLIGYGNAGPQYMRTVGKVVRSPIGRYLAQKALKKVVQVTRAGGLKSNNRNPFARGRRPPTPKKRRMNGGVREIPGHVGGTESSFFHKVKRRVPKGYKIYPTWRLINEASVPLRSNVGDQNFQTVGQFFTYPDMDKMFQDAREKYKDLSGGTNFVTNTNSNQLYLLSANGVLRVSSQSIFTQDMTIYDITCKLSTDLDPMAAIGKIGTDTTGNETIFDVGFHPYMSPAFKRYWKINKVTKVTLAPGAVHRHTVSYQIKKNLSQEMLYQYARNDTNYIGGLTHCLLICLQGYPIHSDEDYSKVSYAEGAVDTCYFETINWKLTPAKIQWIDNVSTIPAIASAHQKGINEFVSTGYTGDPTD